MPRKKKAVALKYNLEQDLAPVVIASGYGEVAERIINIAEERGIPVYRDDSAASMLCMLEVGATIPEDLYQVVATIYVQIMETANRIKEGTVLGSTASIRAGSQRETERRSEGALSAGASQAAEVSQAAADGVAAAIAGTRRVADVSEEAAMVVGAMAGTGADAGSGFGAVPGADADVGVGVGAAGAGTRSGGATGVRDLGDIDGLSADLAAMFGDED